MTSTPPARATPIRVVLADDHPVVRRGLSALLGVGATQQIVRDYPGTAVLVLTMFDEDAIGVTHAAGLTPSLQCRLSDRPGSDGDG